MTDEKVDKQKHLHAIEAVVTQNLDVGKLLEKRGVTVADMRAVFNLARSSLTASPDPVPMLLWCPECGERHVDRDEFATKPHHTHSCQNCGHTWRPAVVQTVGVQFLPGFRDDERAPYTVTLEDGHTETRYFDGSLNAKEQAKWITAARGPIGDLPLPRVQTIHIQCALGQAICGTPLHEPLVDDPMAATCIECKRVHDKPSVHLVLYGKILCGLGLNPLNKSTAWLEETTCVKCKHIYKEEYE